MQGYSTRIMTVALMAAVAGFAMAAILFLLRRAMLVPTELVAPGSACAKVEIRPLGAAGAEAGQGWPADGDEAATPGQDADRLSQIKAAFAHEPIDVDWAVAKKTDIGVLRAGSAWLAHAIKDIDCRSRTCRVEILDDEANLEDNLPRFTAGLATTLPDVTADWVRQADGTGLYVLYLRGD